MDIKLIITILKDGLKTSIIDRLIVYLFIINTIIFFLLLLKSVNKLYRKIEIPKDFRFSKRVINKVAQAIRKTTKPKNDVCESEAEADTEETIGPSILKDLHKMHSLHDCYLGITSLFPLLGMLGTVVALIPMVKEIGNSVQANFFVALTSTFWGLLFSIISKAFDLLVSSKIDLIDNSWLTDLDRSE